MPVHRDVDIEVVFHTLPYNLRPLSESSLLGVVNTAHVA